MCNFGAALQLERWSSCRGAAHALHDAVHALTDAGGRRGLSVVTVGWQRAWECLEAAKIRMAQLNEASPHPSTVPYSSSSS
jgi:hypothetical protein